MKKTVLENIRVIKVENGFVINIGERSFVSLDEDGVKEIINGEVPTLLEELEKKQKDETKKEESDGESRRPTGVGSEDSSVTTADEVAAGR